MSHHFLNYDLSPSVSKTFPQCQDGRLPVPLDHPDFIGSYWFRKFNEQVQVPTLILHRKSKQTDFLSVSMVGTIHRRIVSGRMKEILFSYDTYGIQAIEIPVQVSNGKIVPYQLIDSFRPGYEFLDFSKTKFRYSREYGTPYVPMTISSAEELQHRMDTMAVQEAYLIHDIVLLDHAPDFFALYCVDQYTTIFVISERLKKDLEREQLTGVLYTPLEDVKAFWPSH